MKTSRKLMMAALITTLGAGGAMAGAQVLNGQFPDEVKTSSIKLPRGTPEDQASLLKLSKISQTEAESAALAAAPGGTVRKAKLDDENDHLVWKIDVAHNGQMIELAVDPGNGQILAAEAEEDGDHDDGKARKGMTR